MDGSSEIYVLVVEDEPLIRMAAVDIFEDAGFTVVASANSHDALRALRSMPGLHVLFTDIELPGDMNGLALARVIEEEFPDVALIIVSGRVAPEPAMLPRKAVFLPKPYEATKVLAHARRLKPLVPSTRPQR
jgi:CheY-like chemotaxis protein